MKRTIRILAGLALALAAALVEITAARAQEGAPAQTPKPFLENFPLHRPPITLMDPVRGAGADPYGIEFDTPQPPATPHGYEFDALMRLRDAGCTPLRVAFGPGYQDRVNKFSSRSLLKEQEYFNTPFVDKGAKTPQLTDIIFEHTLLINEKDLARAVQAFKEQTLGFSAEGAWTAQDVRRAIDQNAFFDVCLPLPPYALDPAPRFKFVMNKTELLLHMYQIFEGKDILLASFPTTKGGWNYDAITQTSRGFPTPSGDFWVKRIVYAPSYIHPDWSKSAKQQDAPGFRNPYGIVMAELWKTPDPLCKAEQKQCDGYGWNYAGGTGIRFHTSNLDSNVRNSAGNPRPSHGCNRLFTKDGKRIFTLLYYKMPHAECKMVTRGTVCPFLDTVIPYKIVEK
jgi:hypothetical protein